MKNQKIASNINQLLTSLTKILKDDNVSELSFEEIYNTCYKICIDKGGEDLLKNFETLLNNHLVSISSKISMFLDEEYFKKLVESYSDYINKMSVIQKTMMYFESNFLHKRNLNIKLLSKNIFGNYFFKDNLKIVIRDFLNSNITKDRNKILANKILISNLIKLIVPL